MTWWGVRKLWIKIKQSWNFVLRPPQNHKRHQFMICHDEMISDKLWQQIFNYVLIMGPFTYQSMDGTPVRGSPNQGGPWMLGKSLYVFVTSLYKMVRNAMNTRDRYQECHYLTYLSTQRWYLNTSKMVCVDKKKSQCSNRRNSYDTASFNFATPSKMQRSLLRPKL